MRSFRTVVSISPSKQPIAHRDKIITTGSCFAQAIGDRLQRFKFDALVSPFGVIYNPIAIHKTLLYAVHNEPPAAHTYLENGGTHLNYDFHSSLSSGESQQLRDTLNHLIGTTHHFLARANALLITYGTAWVYTRNETGEIVANCHKTPAANFSKALLSVQDIGNSFRSIHDAAKKLNPGLRFILTVSPVRHLRDTAELNSVSKSVLRLACHQIAGEFANTEYFPAYEIMLDDLRDYRFYKADMIHPTEEAEDYIWEKFAIRYFDESTRAFIQQWSDILSALNHRPFHPGSRQHQQFLADLIRKLEAFKGQVDVDGEIKLVQSQQGTAAGSLRQ